MGVRGLPRNYLKIQEGREGGIKTLNNTLGQSGFELHNCLILENGFYIFWITMFGQISKVIIMEPDAVNLKRAKFFHCFGKY